MFKFPKENLCFHIFFVDCSLDNILSQSYDIILRVNIQHSLTSENYKFLN